MWLSDTLTDRQTYGRASVIIGVKLQYYIIERTCEVAVEKYLLGSEAVRETRS